MYLTDHAREAEPGTGTSSAMNESRVELPSLAVVWDLEYEVWKATALKAALELDIFTIIAQGHRMNMLRNCRLDGRA